MCWVEGRRTSSTFFGPRIRPVSCSFFRLRSLSSLVHPRARLNRSSTPEEGCQTCSGRGVRPSWRWQMCVGNEERPSNMCVASAQRQRVKSNERFSADGALDSFVKVQRSRGGLATHK